MKHISLSLLGGLLVYTLCTSAFAGGSSPSPVEEKPVLEKRVRRLEQTMRTIQTKVEALEDFVYQPMPICPCFAEEDIKPFALESCVVAQNGAWHGYGKHLAVFIAPDFCDIWTPQGAVNLPITPPEQWACIQTLFGQVSPPSGRCAVE